MGAPIIWNGTKAKIIAPGGLIDSSGNTIGGGTLPYTNKTANFTASAGNGYLVNTTAGALTCTLPTGAANSCIRLVDDLGTWKQNNLTIAPATGEKIQGQTTNDTLVCDVAGGWVELNYDTTNTCWNIISSGYAGSTYTGPIVTDWVSYTLAITGSSSNPTKATSPAADEARYRRVGDTLEINYTYKQSSATGAALGSGTYFFGLPAGLTVDTAKLATDTGMVKTVGRCYAYNGTTEYGGDVAVYDGTRVYLSLFNAATTTTNANSTTMPFTNATLRFSFTARIPITEWASQNNIAYQNDVEYAYNSAAFANGSDTTTFAYGKTGLAMATLTGTCTRRVRFTTPINDGDRIKLQVQGVNAGSTWLDADALGMSLIQQGSNAYGHQINGVSGSSTDVDVYFYAYAQCTGITYGAAGTNWNSGWKWRLCKSSGGQVVGFGNVVPGLSAGLVSANGVPGNVTGSAIASGYVGETITSSQTVATSCAASNVWKNIVSVTLTPGVWQISANVQFFKGDNTTSPTGPNDICVSLVTASAGASNPPIDYQSISIDVANITTMVASGHIGPFVVSLNASTTYYLNINSTYTGTAPRHRGVLTGIRIA